MKRSVSVPTGTRRASSRGRGFGNAAPVNGRQAGLQVEAWKRDEPGAHGANIRACETPEFYELHGCPHGRGDK